MRGDPLLGLVLARTLPLVSLMRECPIFDAPCHQISTKFWAARDDIPGCHQHSSTGSLVRGEDTRHQSGSTYRRPSAP